MSLNQSAEKYINQYKRLNRFKRIGIILMLVALVLFVMGLWSNIMLLSDPILLNNFDENMPTMLRLTGFVVLADFLAIYVAYIRPNQRTFRNEGYGVIISDIVKKTLPDCKYKYNDDSFEAIKSTDISTSELIPKNANGFNIYNNIKGVHNSVPFRFCTLEMYNYNTVNTNTYIGHTKIQRERNIKNNVFEGCWFIFDCHIKMNSRVFIVSRHSSSYNDLIYKMKISPLQEILTPDNDFNSMFAVFSYDLESPEYIVNSKMMNYLKYLSKKYNCDPVVYCNNGVISVGINCGRAILRPDTFSIFPVSIESVINSAQSDIAFVADCLNILDFSDYVTQNYTEFKQQNDSMYYTGKDIDTNYPI